MVGHDHDIAQRQVVIMLRKVLPHLLNNPPGRLQDYLTVLNCAENAGPFGCYNCDVIGPWRGVIDSLDADGTAVVDLGIVWQVENLGDGFCSVYEFHLMLILHLLCMGSFVGAGLV